LSLANSQRKPVAPMTNGTNDTLSSCTITGIEYSGSIGMPARAGWRSPTANRSTRIATPPTPSVIRNSRPSRSGTGMPRLRMSSVAWVSRSAKWRRVAPVGISPAKDFWPNSSVMSMVSAATMARPWAHTGARSDRVSSAVPHTATTASRQSISQVQLWKMVAIGAVASKVAAAATSVTCRLWFIAASPWCSS
jgi:hypothetical protein